jgi:hypothetical protein
MACSRINTETEDYASSQKTNMILSVAWKILIEAFGSQASQLIPAANEEEFSGFAQGVILSRRV